MSMPTIDQLNAAHAVAQAAAAQARWAALYHCGRVATAAEIGEGRACRDALADIARDELLLTARLDLTASA